MVVISAVLVIYRLPIYSRRKINTSDDNDDDDDDDENSERDEMKNKI